MNNKVIEDQLGDYNPYLSQLRLAYGCIPFEKMPFSTSLLHHNPRLVDLFDCLDATNRVHEVLVRYVLKNTDRDGQLYTPRAELERFGDIDTLMSTINRTLYNNERYQARRLKERNGHFYIVGYENDTVEIIRDSSNCHQAEFRNILTMWTVGSLRRFIQWTVKRKKTLCADVHPVICCANLRFGWYREIHAYQHISKLFMNQSKLYLANTASSLYPVADV